MESVSSDGPTKNPLIKRDGQLVPATWEEANDLIIENLKAAGDAVGGIHAIIQ